MSSTSIEVTGFAELRQKIKKLGDDKSKTKEVRKILGQLANPLIQTARRLAPVGDGFVTIKGKRYKRARRMVGKRVYQESYQGGRGSSSINKKVMTRARIPVITVSPRSPSNVEKDGFYMRQFVIPGTKNGLSKNYFMDQAYKQTQGQITGNAERKMSKYFQKQIDRLSS